MNLQKEFASLAKAEEDIRLADERIKRHEQLTEELERDGHDVSTAMDLLTVLRDTRDVMLDHRELIVANIRRLTDDRNKA